MECDEPEDIGHDQDTTPDHDTTSLMTSNRPLARPSGSRMKSKSPMTPENIGPMATSNGTPGGIPPMQTTLTPPSYDNVNHGGAHSTRTPGGMHQMQSTLNPTSYGDVNHGNGRINQMQSSVIPNSMGNGNHGESHGMTPDGINQIQPTSTTTSYGNGNQGESLGEMRQMQPAMTSTSIGNGNAHQNQHLVHGNGRSHIPTQNGLREPQREPVSNSYPIYRQPTAPPPQPNVPQNVPQTTAVQQVQQVPMSGYIVSTQNVVNGGSQIGNVGNGASHFLIVNPGTFASNQPQTLMMTNSGQQQGFPVKAIPVSFSTIPTTSPTITPSTAETVISSNAVIPPNTMMPPNSGMTPNGLPNGMPNGLTSTNTVMSNGLTPGQTMTSVPSKYPRDSNINGKMWYRGYSKTDRKYYWMWTDGNGQRHKEWDPWTKNGKQAPWMQSKQSWAKFKDQASGKPYFYNYDTKQSTFERPGDYQSEPEIDCDSADENGGNEAK